MILIGTESSNRMANVRYLLSLPAQSSMEYILKVEMILVSDYMSTTSSSWRSKWLLIWKLVSPIKKNSETWYISGHGKRSLQLLLAAWLISAALHLLQNILEASGDIRWLTRMAGTLLFLLQHFLGILGNKEDFQLCGSLCSIDRC